MAYTAKEIAAAQRACNAFTNKFLAGVTPLIVDGVKGKATNSRIMACRYYLGWGSNRTSRIDATLLALLKNPHRLAKDYPAPQMRKTGMQRRTKQRADWEREHMGGADDPGVTTFDGVPCANWLVPYLKWARANGWRGKLVSGWRSPAYSDSLCRKMCGKPKCPGLCAGRDSNHAGSVKPKGALDVSDYITFARVIARCPHKPRIYNDLPRDRVHFSSNGH